MGEFYEDGIKILRYFKKHRSEYFSVRNCRLLGIEMPLVVEVEKNTFLKGYLDVVLYDETLNKVIIIDFKTSTRGWKDKEKKDEIKTSQLVMYKEYFAQQYNWDVENIDIEFIILKRKIWEQSEFKQSHLQSFKPASGKTTRNKVIKNFKTFLSECFNQDGKPNLEREFTKNFESCRFCPIS